MLRRLSQSGVKHALSTPSLRAAAVQTQARTFVSTVLLTNEGYEKKQVTELRAMLRQRGLTTTGRKAELIQRLKQNDMARSGSSLATAGVAKPATPITAPLSRAKSTKAPSSSQRAKKGKDAVAHAEKTMPSVSLEAGTVISATADHEGNIGKASPSEEHHEVTGTPGLPEVNAEAVAQAEENKSTNTFNIVVPFEVTPPPEPQYIPTIQAFVDPTRDFSDSFKPEWHIPHMPKVHTVTGADVSHLPSLGEAQGKPEPSKKMKAMLDMAGDIVPAHWHRRLSQNLTEAESSANGIIREIIQDTMQSMPVDPSVQPSHSRARPSTRRPLNHGERRGLWVLGGIAASGFMLGGLLKPSETETSSTTTTSTAPVYQPPHYTHGGGVVGAVQRKV
ncbi:poly(A)+ mRNA export from nucleus protein [Malassezia pachydermatis]|uniref:SAP domain-containing protein n=1 Tax=Malassezia pachydermatis TaxID=77020 RepID=A0A0M8ML69_9BASI|nr:hypothetical protein Malapachy_1958 [Malassezia pachydermatis]KOS13788.1 hypothetical protein Malapachy_1958 [Malassezia pachydermatis]